MRQLLREFVFMRSWLLLIANLFWVGTSIRLYVLGSTAMYSLTSLNMCCPRDIFESSPHVQRRVESVCIYKELGHSLSPINFGWNFNFLQYWQHIVITLILLDDLLRWITLFFDEKEQRASMNNEFFLGCSESKGKHSFLKSQKLWPLTIFGHSYIFPFRFGVLNICHICAILPGTASTGNRTVYVEFFFLSTTSFCKLLSSHLWDLAVTTNSAGVIDIESNKTNPLLLRKVCSIKMTSSNVRENGRGNI